VHDGDCIAKRNFHGGYPPLCAPASLLYLAKFNPPTVRTRFEMRHVINTSCTRTGRRDVAVPSAIILDNIMLYATKS
jgi:hypothetical protein